MDWLISFGVHAAIVAALVIVPMLFTQALDLTRVEITYLAAPPTPYAPPPPPAGAFTPRAPRKILPTTAQLTMPTAIPKTVPKQSGDSDAPPGSDGGSSQAAQRAEFLVACSAAFLAEFSAARVESLLPRLLPLRQRLVLAGRFKSAER